MLTNTESTARQYALRQRAIALGWPADQVVVIDCDQGHSGASAADREGFQRLVAEVGMGRAGIVLGLEVSRLARNNADWHRLLELCCTVDTLICDEDGLYDPCDFNDRLLLGLERHDERGRAALHPGPPARRHPSKARRGELPVPLPVGLVYDPAGKVVLDPDVGVQQAMRHLFATFARTGSARAIVQAFADEGLLVPGPGAQRPPQRRARLDASAATGECCARCTTPATPGRSSLAATGGARPRRAVSSLNFAPRTVDRRSSPTPTPATSPGRPSRPTSTRSPTPRPTAKTAGPARPGKGRRCSKAWRSAGGAAGA